MSMEDGHFRTDGESLEECCWDCDLYVNGNGVDEGVWTIIEENYPNLYSEIDLVLDVYGYTEE